MLGLDQRAPDSVGCWGWILERKQSVALYQLDAATIGINVENANERTFKTRRKRVNSARDELVGPARPATRVLVELVQNIEQSNVRTHNWLLRQSTGQAGLTLRGLPSESLSKQLHPNSDVETAAIFH